MTDQKRKLRECAVVVFAQKGYAAATMRDIASCMGVQAPSLYNHLKSKQTLLLDVLSEIIQEVIDCVQAAVSDRTEPVEDRLRAAFEAFVLYNLSKPDHAGLHESELRSLEPENLAVFAARRGEVDRIFRDLITEGIASGVFESENPVLTVRALVSAAARTHMWYRPDRDPAPSEIARLLASHFVNGLLARRCEATSDGSPDRPAEPLRESVH